MSSDGPTQIFSEPPHGQPTAAVLDIIFVHGLVAIGLQPGRTLTVAFGPVGLPSSSPRAASIPLGLTPKSSLGFSPAKVHLFKI